MGEWIYTIYDPGYPLGVKIGRSRDVKRFTQKPPGHSPRSMQCLGAWYLNDEQWQCLVDSTGGTDNTAEGWFRDLEGVDSLSFQERVEGTDYKNGQEFMDISPDDAIRILQEKIDDRFGSITREHSGELLPSNDFQRSSEIVKGRTRFREGRHALFVWSENLTNIIKVQRSCHWYGALQARWTYSRNGVIPVAAYTYSHPEGPDDYGNLLVERVWQSVVREFGTDGSDKFLGWLSHENASLNSVDKLVKASGLSSVEELGFSLRDRNRGPVGMKTTNNNSRKSELYLPEDLESFFQV